MDAYQNKPDGSAIARFKPAAIVPELAELPEPDSLLTVEDVADMLKLPVTWVYERTRRRGIGRLPGFRLGKYWRFRRDEILAWLEEHRARNDGNGGSAKRTV